MNWGPNHYFGAVTINKGICCCRSLIVDGVIFNEHKVKLRLYKCSIYDRESNRESWGYEQHKTPV